MVVSHASKEDVWIHRLCLEIGFKKQAMRINCNSQSAICLAKNRAYHSRMKHIDVGYFFVRDIAESKKVMLEKVNSLETIENYLTNSASVLKFYWCRKEMGIVSLCQ